MARGQGDKVVENRVGRHVRYKGTVAVKEWLVFAVQSRRGNGLPFSSFLQPLF